MSVGQSKRTSPKRSPLCKKDKSEEFYENEAFTSYKQFEKKFNRYKAASILNKRVRKMRSRLCAENELLKYEFVEFHCRYGVTTKESKCPVLIQLKAKKRILKFHKLILKHNHDQTVQTSEAKNEGPRPKRLKLEVRKFKAEEEKAKNKTTSQNNNHPIPVKRKYTAKNKTNITNRNGHSSPPTDKVSEVKNGIKKQKNGTNGEEHKVKLAPNGMSSKPKRNLENRSSNGKQTNGHCATVDEEAVIKKTSESLIKKALPITIENGDSMKKQKCRDANGFHPSLPDQPKEANQKFKNSDMDLTNDILSFNPEETNEKAQVIIPDEPTTTSEVAIPSGSSELNMSTSNLLEKAAEKLLHQPGSGLYLFKKNEILDAILYQDRQMKLIFSRFPEILFIDTTLKVNSLNLPLYMFLNEDNNGCSHIVGLLFLNSADSDSAYDVATVFKQKNPSWIRTCELVLDPEFPCRGVFAQQFVNAELHICPYHVMRILHKDMSFQQEADLISSSEKCVFNEIITRMIKAKNEVGYQQIYEKLNALQCNNLKSYFNTRWHPVRYEWVRGLHSNPNSKLGSKTSDHLISVSRRANETLKGASDLDGLLDGVMALLRGIHSEFKEKAAMMMMSEISYEEFDESQPEYRYQQLLTAYAFLLVQKEIYASRTVHVKPVENVKAGVKPKTFTVEDNDVISHVTENLCQLCCKSVATMLPCKHIFAVRTYLNLDLFDIHLCSPRWAKSYVHTDY